MFKEIEWLDFILFYMGGLAGIAGLFYGITIEKWLFQKHLRLFLIIGILGGLVAKTYYQPKIFIALLMVYAVFYLITILAWVFKEYLFIFTDDYFEP